MQLWTVYLTRPAIKSGQAIRGAIDSIFHNEAYNTDERSPPGNLKQTTLAGCERRQGTW
jgi:hypothetical protein